MMTNYSSLLDRAFSMLPTLSEEKVDFKIPEADSHNTGQQDHGEELPPDSGHREEGRRT